MRRILLPTVLLLIAAASAHAAPPGFAFLELPTGARAAALGGAYASLATGPEAAFWNAAGVAETRGLEVAAGHAELMEKLRHDYFSLGGRMFGGGVAASVRALYSEPIEERDDLGNLIGSFGAHDLELAFSYGRPVAAGLALGGSVALIRERISNLAAQTYAFGVGGTWSPASLEGLRLGFAGQNLGPSAHYTIDGVQGEPVGLPAAFQTGVSYTRGVGERFHATGSLEGRATRGKSGIGFVGTELADVTGASLRLGRRFNDTASTLSYGAGYVMQSITLDYAFVPFRDDLGDTHRFAFRAKF
jgi:hypothetical protein